MEALIFVGIQGAGKSTFFRERFFDSHVRINLDMLRTRHREKILVDACLAAKQPFVIDNTNPTRVERASYIALAKATGFRVVCYYFAAQLEGCKRRNEAREVKKVVPLAGLLGTYRRLELPAVSEGFDALYYVSVGDGSQFQVAEWRDEV